MRSTPGHNRHEGSPWARFVREFTCADHSGRTAACQGAPEGPAGPQVPLPWNGYGVRCPIAARVQCQPFQQWLEQENERQRPEVHRRWLRQGRDMGIPKRYLEVTFETVETTPVTQRVREYLAHEAPRGRCLMLMGPTGTGKTMAAVCALRACSSEGRFVFTPDLVSTVTAGAFQERHGALKLAKQAELLVVDDLGAEQAKSGGLGATTIDELLVQREAELLPTIITTNLVVDELRARLTDRLVDRLKGEWGALFTAAGESRRTSA